MNNEQLKTSKRSEEEILKDFENLGYKVYTSSILFMLIKPNKDKFFISKGRKEFIKYNWGKGQDEAVYITLQEHKLLHELFECWGWF